MMEQQKTAGNCRPWVFGQIYQFIWTFLPESFRGRFPVGPWQYINDGPHGTWKNVPWSPSMMYSQKTLQEPSVVRQNVNFEQILTSKNQSRNHRPGLHCSVIDVPHGTYRLVRQWCTVGDLPWLVSGKIYQIQMHFQPIFRVYFSGRNSDGYIIDGPHGRWVRI